MPKKKSEHYVNNKEFLEAIVNYRARVSTHFIENFGREPTKAWDRDWETNMFNLI